MGFDRAFPDDDRPPSTKPFTIPSAYTGIRIESTKLSEFTFTFFRFLSKIVIFTPCLMINTA